MTPAEKVRARKTATKGKPAPSTNGKPQPSKPPAASAAESSSALKPPPPSYRPFPVDALPKPLQRFVNEGAQAIGCDEAFIALPALAVAAGLVGTMRFVRLKRTWKEPAVIWAVCVADPSSMKSPAFNLVRWPLIGLQKRLDETYGKHYAAYQEAAEQWKGADKETRGEKPEAPSKPEAFISDCTIERLAEILLNNPRGALLARDELSAWFGSFARYKGKGGKRRAELVRAMASWRPQSASQDGDTARRVRSESGLLNHWHDSARRTGTMPIVGTVRRWCTVSLAVRDAAATFEAVAGNRPE